MVQCLCVWHCTAFAGPSTPLFRFALIIAVPGSGLFSRNLPFAGINFSEFKTFAKGIYTCNINGLQFAEDITESRTFCVA